MSRSSVKDAPRSIRGLKTTSSTLKARASGGGHATGINTTFHNNLYFNIKPHVSDKRPVLADPIFVSPGQARTGIDLATMAGLAGYQLKPGSPCIDAGTVIKAAGQRDLMGIHVPEHDVDLGAFQTVSPR